MYDFQQRPDGGPGPWTLPPIDYTPWGGAVAYDFPDVEVGDRIVVASTRPDAGQGNSVLCSVFYPNAKQTEAKQVAWGKPVQFVSEQAGMVTVLVSANAAGQVRVIGRA